MPKFPEPPTLAELQKLGPEIKTLRAGHQLWRLYFAGGRHPTGWSDFRAFGPTDSRFDHQLLPRRVQARKILYCAGFGPTCFAEVFQATRTADRNFNEPWLTCFELTRDVALLDLTGAWVTRAGASTAIHSGSRSRARRWSAAAYAAFPTIEGLAYCSSMDGNRPAYALYERATSAMPSMPIFNRALADPALARAVNGAAKRFGFVVV